MTQLAALKAATSLNDIAKLLGYKPSALSYILYKLSDTEKYNQFNIVKRSGGTRIIKAPTPELKLLQRKLADLLEHCNTQLNYENGRLDQLAHGFKRGRSIFSNANPHRNRRWVFNIDLMDFFGTINFGRVRGFFIKDRGFALNEKVATVLAQIACIDNSLPQGSPCSPIISNLIGHLLDIHLAKLAASVGCRYSRYADDLTFSTNKPQFPTNIACLVSPTQNQWIPGDELVRLINYARFSINPQKTRMQYRDSRQEVTGLIVNKKVNVKSEYRRTVRAMVHRLLSRGHFERIKRIDDGTGKHILTSVPGTTNELHGMLGFIESVEHYNRNITSQIGGKAKDERKKIPRETNKSRNALTGKDRLYYRFLLYKEFFAAARPVIVCEGETDNIYLIHAIRSLASAYPMLATTPKPGEIKITPRLFKYVETRTGHILGLSGGTGDISNLIRNYSKEIKHFIKPVSQHPTILLIDNDDGATGQGGPLQAVQNVTNKPVDRTAPFTHITGNLYLITTPLLNNATQSKIEDFFDQATLKELIDGKSFCAEKIQNLTKQYGKKIFAHKVIRQKADTIDFNLFTALLNNITLALEDFYKKHSAITVAVKP